VQVKCDYLHSNVIKQKRALNIAHMILRKERKPLIAGRVSDRKTAEGNAIT
jgi:hypothetical protein